MLRQLPRSWEHVERFQSGALRALCAQWIAGKWADSVDSSLCEAEKQDFGKALPPAVQADASRYTEEVRAWSAENDGWLSEFRSFA